MRVLMTNYEFPPLGGGAGKMAAGLAQRLALSGEEIDVLTMGASDLRAHERSGDVSIYRVPTSRRDRSACTVFDAATYVARAMPRLKSLARTRPYDLIHSHFVFPDGFLAMRASRRLRVPYIITAHGTDVPGHNPHRVRFLHAVLRPLWRRVTSRAAAVVCPSEALAEKVRRVNPQASIEVVPNALDADRFSPDAARRPRLLGVARMVRLKGFQYLLQALRSLDQPRELVLVGDGPYAGELRSTARSLGLDVTFTGWLDGDSPQLTELYETSEIFVLPSEAENCPLVLIEAMAAGLPIITTSDPGCRALVGDAAIIVPPRDPAALAEAITRLAGDEGLRRELGEAGRRRAMEHYSWQSLVSRYREIYAQHAR